MLRLNTLNYEMNDVSLAPLLLNEKKKERKREEENREKKGER